MLLAKFGRSHNFKVLSVVLVYKTFSPGKLSFKIFPNFSATPKVTSFSKISLDYVPFLFKGIVFSSTTFEKITREKTIYRGKI